MKKIAVFASGTGTNAKRLIEYFRQNELARVTLIVCNKPGAGVISVAETESVPHLIIEKERFFHGDSYLPVLAEYGIGFIVLAGFLWKVPPRLITSYPDSIVNIHPALLPKYGGKGMYGNKVHSAVIASGEQESGISIHYVNEVYDEGKMILQVACPVLPGDDPDSLASRIHALEHYHYPRVVEKLISESASFR